MHIMCILYVHILYQTISSVPRVYTWVRQVAWPVYVCTVKYAMHTCMNGHNNSVFIYVHVHNIVKYGDIYNEYCT